MQLTKTVKVLLVIVLTAISANAQPNHHNPLNRFARLLGRSGQALVMPWKDWKFSLAAYTMIAASYADIKTTSDCFDRSRSCVEGGIFFHHQRPSLGKMAAVSMPITFAEIVTVKWMKENTDATDMRGVWVLPVAIHNGGHGYAAGANSTLGRH